MKCLVMFSWGACSLRNEWRCLAAFTRAWAAKITLRGLWLVAPTPACVEFGTYPHPASLGVPNCSARALYESCCVNRIASLASQAPVCALPRHKGYGGLRDGSLSDEEDRLHENENKVSWGVGWEGGVCVGGGACSSGMWARWARWACKSSTHHTAPGKSVPCCARCGVYYMSIALTPVHARTSTPPAAVAGGRGGTGQGGGREHGCGRHRESQ